MFRETRGDLTDLARHFFQTSIRHVPRALVQRLAFADQCIEDLDAFFLRFGKCTQTSEPDLLGRRFDGRSELRIAADTVWCSWLDFLDHEDLLEDEPGHCSRHI